MGPEMALQAPRWRSGNRRPAVLSRRIGMHRLEFDSRLQSANQSASCSAVEKSTRYHGIGLALAFTFATSFKNVAIRSSHGTWRTMAPLVKTSNQFCANDRLCSQVIYFKTEPCFQLPMGLVGRIFLPRTAARHLRWFTSVPQYMTRRCRATQHRSNLKAGAFKRCFNAELSLAPVRSTGKPSRRRMLDISTRKCRSSRRRIRGTVNLMTTNSSGLSLIEKGSCRIGFCCGGTDAPRHPILRQSSCWIEVEV